MSLTITGVEPLQNRALSLNYQRLVTNRNWSELDALLARVAETQQDSDFNYYKAISRAYGTEPHDISQAIELLKHSVVLDPTNEKAQSALSELFLVSGQHKQAEHHAIALQALAPANPLSHLMLGKILAAQQRYDIAAPHFATCIELIPKQNTTLIETVQKLARRWDPVWWKPVRSRNIELHRLSERHRQYYEGCYRDPVLREQLNLFKKTDQKAFDRDLEKNTKSPLDSNKIDWIVIANGERIGIISLVDINMNNRRAEMIVGFPSATRSSLKTVESTCLALSFAFQQLNINRVCSYVYSNNVRSEENTLKLGFLQEGALREHIVHPNTGEPLNMYVNGLLKADFYRNNRIAKYCKRWQIGVC